eukprot:jgi/Chrzof1/154/Cz01g05110.t1
MRAPAGVRDYIPIPHTFPACKLGLEDLGKRKAIGNPVQPSAGQAANKRHCPDPDADATGNTMNNHTNGHADESTGCSAPVNATMAMPKPHINFSSFNETIRQQQEASTAGTSGLRTFDDLVAADLPQARLNHHEELEGVGLHVLHAARTSFASGLSYNHIHCMSGVFHGT